MGAVVSSGPEVVFSATSEAMRRILVERARARNRLKRGGDLKRTDLNLSKISMANDALDMEALDTALSSLEKNSSRGGSVDQTKILLGVAMEGDCGANRGVDSNRAEKVEFRESVVEANTRV